ncbi:hypothetical protein KC358_g30 [Hortaea werneckii]|nr:hypothetical protein KC358_g30 [Hortaea werneckii]
MEVHVICIQQVSAIAPDDVSVKWYCAFERLRNALYMAQRSPSGTKLLTLQSSGSLSLVQILNLWLSPAFSDVPLHDPPRGRKRLMRCRTRGTRLGSGITKRHNNVDCHDALSLPWVVARLSRGRGELLRSACAVRSSSRREASEEASAKPAHSAGLLLRARRDFHLGLATTQHFNFIQPLPASLKEQSKLHSYVEFKQVIKNLDAADSQHDPDRGRTCCRPHPPHHSHEAPSPIHNQVRNCEEQSERLEVARYLGSADSELLASAEAQHRNHASGPYRSLTIKPNRYQQHLVRKIPHKHLMPVLDSQS